MKIKSKNNYLEKNVIEKNFPHKKIVKYRKNNIPQKTNHLYKNFPKKINLKNFPLKQFFTKKIEKSPKKFNLKNSPKRKFPQKKLPKISQKNVKSFRKKISL